MDDFLALFFCDAWSLEKYHGEISLMILDRGLTFCLKEELFIVLFMSHGAIGGCVNKRVKDIGFEDSNPFYRHVELEASARVVLC